MGVLPDKHLRVFHCMTVKECLDEVGRTASNHDMRFLGSHIRDRARTEGVKWGKKSQSEEGIKHPVRVNDYPETFSSTIFQEIDKYFLAKEHENSLKKADMGNPISAKIYKNSIPPSIVSEPKAKRPRIKKEGGNG